MTFDEVFTHSNLWDAAQKCYLGVGWKGSVQIFKAHDLVNTYKIWEKLQHTPYVSMPFYEFLLRERGKLRHIKSLHIRERVMQKCLCDQYLIPLLTPKLIYDNGACIRNKGISFTRKRFVKHLRAFHMTHGFTGYVMTFDFSKYFDSINHQVLFDLLRPIVKCDRLYNHIKTLIQDFGDRGLGLGSEISQILALFYADKIDRHIKENARIKYYGRYMDDGYLFHPSKEYLQQVKQEIIEVVKTLGITINYKKTQIHKVTKGITWLKTRYYLTATGKIMKKPWRQNVVRMRRKLKKFYAMGLPEEAILCSYMSWSGCMKYHDAHQIMLKMDKLKKELYNDYKRTNNRHTHQNIQ